MIIGNLTYDHEADTYAGELTTLSVGSRKLVFEPSEATNEGAPEYRVVNPRDGGDVEFGAAWKRQSKDGQEYLSVRLDDPAFPHPFNCGVVAAKDSAEQFLLIWTRKKPDDGKTAATGAKPTKAARKAKAA